MGGANHVSKYLWRSWLDQDNLLTMACSNNHSETIASVKMLLDTFDNFVAGDNWLWWFKVISI